MMATTNLANKYLIKASQYHPFHMLASSKLPIFIAVSVGLTALTFITKLHAIG